MSMPRRVRQPYASGDLFAFQFPTIAGWGVGLVLRKPRTAPAGKTDVVLLGFDHVYNQRPALGEASQLCYAHTATCIRQSDECISTGVWPLIGPMPGFSYQAWPLPVLMHGYYKDMPWPPRGDGQVIHVTEDEELRDAGFYNRGLLTDDEYDELPPMQGRHMVSYALPFVVEQVMRDRPPWNTFKFSPRSFSIWKRCVEYAKARGLYPAPEPLFTPKPRRKKGEPIPPAAEAAGRGLWPFVHYVREQAGADRDRFLALLSEGREQAGGRAGAALRRQFRDALKACSTWDLWAAAYIMNGGCSDDGFLYFRAWLIMQGQDIVERAIADPDSLADAELRYFEDDAAEAEDVLEVLLDDTDPPGGRPRGAKFSEDGEHLRARLPRLAAKYMT